MSRRELLGLLVLAALWGASYMFIKIALEDLSPAMVVAVRTALAALVLVPFALQRGALRGMSGALGTVIVLGVVQVAGPFLLISAGEQEVSSSLTGILISSTPLFTALLAVWVDQAERSSGARAIGLLVGFMGVAVLIGVDLGGSSNALLGGLAIVLAALGYAIGSFIVKRSAARVQPVGVAAATMVVATVVTAPFALLGAPAAIPSAGTIASMLVLGLLGTGVAFAIFYTLTAQIGPARVALVTYIAPAFAVVYGVTLLGERLTLGTLAGLALIVGGSWLAAGGGFPHRRAPVRSVPAYAAPGPGGDSRAATDRSAA